VNFALPALVILLGILPGVVFERAYFAGRFARKWAGLSTGSEVALYVLLAIPVDLAAADIAKHAGLVIHWDTLLRLLMGSTSDAQSLAIVSESIAGSIRATPISYGLTVFASYALGAVLRRLVWALRLDLRIHILRMKNEWFYQLLGRRIGIEPGAVAMADVLATLPAPEGTRLYRGIVSHFQLSASGGLELLTLTAARRGKGRGLEFEWKDIPGNGIMLLGECIHSINVSYYSLTPDEAQGFWRRFIFEEQ